MNKIEDRKVMACPLNGKTCIDGRRSDFEKNEIGVQHECRWWIHVYGKNPQSEKIIDNADCTVPYLATIQIEGNQETRFVSSEVNEVRKEVRRNNHFTRKLMMVAFRGGRAIANLVNQRLSGPREVKEKPIEISVNHTPNGNGSSS